MCRHVGKDPRRRRGPFAVSSGGANMLKVRGPLLLAPCLAIHPTSSVRKHLRAVMVEERTLWIYSEASRTGWGGRDGSSLPASGRAVRLTDERV